MFAVSNSWSGQSNVFQRSVYNGPETFPLSKQFLHFSNIVKRQCCVLQPSRNPHWYFEKNLLKKEDYGPEKSPYMDMFHTVCNHAQHMQCLFKNSANISQLRIQTQQTKKRTVKRNKENFSHSQKITGDNHGTFWRHCQSHRLNPVTKYDVPFIFGILIMSAQVKNFKI